MKISKCDLCGKEFDEFDTQENFGLHYSGIGYGSKFDFDEMMYEYIIPRLKMIPLSFLNKSS